jgi:hypothetical protein
VTLPMRLLLTLLVLWLGATPLAQTAPRKPNTLATRLFTELKVRVVPCPAYAFAGGNEPVCGVSERPPEAYIRAFDRVAGGWLEPLDAWREDHGVQLRRYRYRGADYAAVYTPLAETFNVQLVRLK